MIKNRSEEYIFKDSKPHFDKTKIEIQEEEKIENSNNKRKPPFSHYKIKSP
jgi:hypothetical protein